MGLVLLGASALAVYVGCRLSPTVNYFTKFFFFCVLSLLAATIFIPLMLFKPRDSRNGLLPAWFLRVTMRVVGLSYEIRGKENIVKNSGCVVLINHQSLLDLIILAYIWPLTPRGCTIAKREIFYLWPFGLGSWLWGTVFIDRLHPDRAQKDLNMAGAHIKTGKARIVIFPEGTRHRGEDILPLKKGAFHLALTANCPIQPVIVNNYSFLNHNPRKFECGQNYITFLPAISTVGLSKDDMPALMERVHKEMDDGYKKINAQLRW